MTAVSSQGFKEVGKAGREQAIVTAAGRILEGVGCPEPLLTQLDWTGVGWTRAIVSTSRLQFHLCSYFWLPRQAPKRGQAGSNSSRCFLPMGPESTSRGSA